MRQRIGYVYGLGAYLSWGVFPLFFSLLSAVNPFELVPWRVLTALGFCAVVTTLIRGWGRFAAIMRSPRMRGWFLLCSVLLYANWQFFVVGIVTGHIIETALGYFITPLVTILIGVIVRKEKLRGMQWVAVAVALIGVLVSAIAYGRFPFIALGLALTFGLYGAVRKQVSEDVDALTGLTVETVFGSIIAIAQLALLSIMFGHLGAFEHGPAVTIPLLLSGTVTAIPLMLFAAGNRRLKLSHMGFLQFITPIMNFITGYFLFGEPMSLTRWVGFITVWIAVILLIIDMFRTVRKDGKSASAQAQPETGVISL